MISVLRTVRDLDRLRQITQVLIKHGFGEIAGRMGLPGAGDAERPTGSMEQLGQRVRLVLQDLGTTFVKLGQIMSTRADLLPEAVISELAKLQDDVAPVPVEQIKARIEDEIGAPIDVIFASFEDTPIGCASVAQVHCATLRLDEEGDPVDVVIKVQRPGIDKTVERDLSLLHTLARLAERTIPEARIYSPTGLVTEFEEAIRAELDFVAEGRNAQRFADNFFDEEAIHFPKVYRHVSTRRVLTMERLHGLKIDEAVRRGADGKWLAATAVRFLLRMVFEDGFFHADPHPGNILVLPPPPPGGRYAKEQSIQIGLLDLGLVGRLSPDLRDRAMDLVLAAARQDSDALADAMLAIGRPRGRVDEPAFRRYVARVSEQHLGVPLNEMDATAILRDCVAGAMKFDIEMPAELTMLLRAVMTIEGVGKQLDPDLDVLQAARPHLVRMLKARYHPARIGRDLLREAGRVTAVARDLPNQVRDIIEDLRRGQLEVKTVDEASARATERLGRQLRASVLAAAMLGSGVALLINSSHPALAWSLVAGAGGWVAGHIALDLLRR